ncbi:MAG: DNA polymerase III subunit gamma/tau [Desulfomonilaceae bacterium]
MPSYLVLARKYRPKTFSEVIGQDHVIRTLSNSIRSGRVAHAFLFCGVRGVGKTTVARILAKTLNCSGRPEGEADPCNVCTSCKEIAGGISVDVHEIDGASNTSVDNIREINENIKYPPVSSPYKIIIIDEVHMISINAFNALLKTLEEPPPHAKFIFATTESHKVPSTINSRCQRFNFRTISAREIANGMDAILKQEGLAADEEALSLVAREAQGSFRDALSLLDQVIAFGSKRIAPEDVIGILGIAGRDSFGRLVQALLERDAASALTVVHEVFQHGYDPEQLMMDLIQYVRNLIVVKTVPPAARVEGLIDASASELEEMESLTGMTTAQELQNFFSILVRSEGEIKRSGNPWVALEMTVLKLAYAPDIADLSEILRHINSGSSLSPHNPAGGRRSVATPPVAAKSGRSGTKGKPASPPDKGTSEQNPADRQEEIPPERFTITQVLPVPTGTPDEIWSSLKQRISLSGQDPVMLSLMDHGTLISFGPTEVEIGFHKEVYKEQFEDRLQNKTDLRSIFEEFFGGARLKILTLARETSLDTKNPYSASSDGQTDLDRALKNEAMENPITKAVLSEFEDSSIVEVKILSKP